MQMPVLSFDMAFGAKGDIICFYSLHVLFPLFVKNPGMIVLMVIVVCRLQTFYGRHHELVDHYDISISLFPFT